MKKVLRDGLILRSLSEGVASDRANMGQFYVDVFREAGDEDAITFIDWTADLLSEHHPTTSLDDFWVVVDPAKNDEIVSALLLIPQTWQYEAIEIPVGRIELVATHKDYRRRGLVRELMNVAHDRSESLGHIMQSITGIDHYYRQFGYGMAVDLGTGAQLPMTSIPKLKAEQSAKYSLRPASKSDLANICAWDNYAQRDCVLTVKRDEALWNFDLTHRHSETPYSRYLHIIVDDSGNDVGFVSLGMDHFYQRVVVENYSVGEDASYLSTYDDVLRGIKAVADIYYKDSPTDKYPIKISFDSGIPTPLRQLIEATSGGQTHDTVYAWYLRVVDLPTFIQKIAPVLERRLVGSGANRYTGELKIGFYNLKGLKITFEKGRITEVIMQDMAQFGYDAAFPYDTFLNVLFGHRSVTEITRILPEVSPNRKAKMLLSVLFPKKRSSLDAIA